MKIRFPSYVTQECFLYSITVNSWLTQRIIWKNNLNLCAMFSANHCDFQPEFQAFFLTGLLISNHYKNFISVQLQRLLVGIAFYYTGLYIYNIYNVTIYMYYSHQVILIDILPGKTKNRSKSTLNQK